MLEAKRTYYFNDEAEPIFKRKLGELHDRFNSKLIMCGVDFIGTDMQKVTMSKMPGYDQKACEKIMGGFLEFQPGIHVVLTDDQDEKNFELIVCDLYDEDYVSPWGVTIDNVYVIQNAYKYPYHDRCLYQLWVLLEDVVIDDINNFWND